MLCTKRVYDQPTSRTKPKMKKTLFELQTSQVQVQADIGDASAAGDEDDDDGAICR